MLGPCALRHALRSSSHRLKSAVAFPSGPGQNRTCASSSSAHTGAVSVSEADIVRDFRQGNFERGVRRFCKRPRAQRSNALHETVVLACAQVPDAAAAEAVLHAMPKPTMSAVANVVNAQCREQNVHAAIDTLERLPDWGLPMEHRIVAGVERAARIRAGAATRSGEENDALQRLGILTDRFAVVRSRSRSRSTAPSAAELFAEDGGDCDAWLDGCRGASHPKRGGVSAPAPYFRRSLEYESSLRAASGDVGEVERLWAHACNDAQLSTEIGIMVAAVSAFISSGWTGSTLALDALMSWVTTKLLDQSTGRGRSVYVDSPTYMALLVTSTTKALAAAARSSPQLALSAFDALWSMQLPGFSSSLPLSGAYFKVLQHAELPLDETRARIDALRERHIQLDEQSFSMALGAILRCDAFVADKLVAGKAWLDVMRSAGMPLTVHTYNLFAGQLRYCNDPDMVTALLRDMSNTGVTPTAVTYGLIFGACVIPGDYASQRRKNSLPVPVWIRVLQAMEEHMVAGNVAHTANSRLSLARAYAHLGCVDEAEKHFGAYESTVRSTDHSGNPRYLQSAYNQMIFNFAHCRDHRQEAPHAAFAVYEHMKAAAIRPSNGTLEALLVSSTRLGDAGAAVAIAADMSRKHSHVRLHGKSIEYMLLALAQVCTVEAWESCVELLRRSSEGLSDARAQRSIQSLVLAYARQQQRGVCDDIIALTGGNIPDLDMVLAGREFSRFRGVGRRAEEDSRHSASTLKMSVTGNDGVTLSQSEGPLRCGSGIAGDGIDTPNSIAPLT